MVAGPGLGAVRQRQMQTHASTRQRGAEFADTYEKRDAGVSDLRQKRRGDVARAMKRSWAALQRQKKRIARTIAAVLVILGLGMVAVTVVGAIFLERAELCRFPQFSLTETFIYNIDLASTGIFVGNTTQQIGSNQGLFTSSKNLEVRGPRLREIKLTSGYGTYTVRAHPDPAATRVEFEVTNRARDRSKLTAITDMELTPVQVITGVGKFNRTETWYDLLLESKTNNKNDGQLACTRADVVVLVPAACLLDETLLTIEAPKAHVTVEESMFDASLKEVSVLNDIGDITVGGLSAQRINLNTSTGLIEASKLSAHVVFLQGRADGAIIRASDVALFSSDGNCQLRSVFTEGFPREEAYRKDVLVCELVAGEITVDSEGAENGGDPAVILDDVKGGSIRTSVRVGTTVVRTQACIGFVGAFRLATASGTPAVNVIGGPRNALLILPNTNQTELKPLPGTVEEQEFYDEKRAAFPQYPWPNPWLVATPELPGTTGLICQNFTGFALEQAQARRLEMEALHVGDVVLDITEPFLGVFDFDDV
ncbi:unnamed protein product [Pedinophyceae sp. YPF-701]|nr:unnamed protein product [Pedinophyceae sp. YPF-701]